MILTCSSCSTRYLIDPVSIGIDGREVKCAKCGHRWREMPPADSPKTVADAPPEIETENAGQSIEEMLARPVRKAHKKNVKPARKINWIGWILFLALVGGVAAGGFFLRNQVVDMWPPAMKLYKILHLDVKPTNKLGLVIDAVQSKTVIDNGVTTLTVSGKIKNITDQEQPVPRVSIQLLNKKGHHVYSWTRTLETTTVPAWAEIDFSTSMKQPPKEAVKVQVNFAAVKKPDPIENKPAEEKH
jgi:predicted Zn finger-like uncharacterized protein